MIANTYPSAILKLTVDAAGLEGWVLAAGSRGFTSTRRRTAPGFIWCASLSASCAAPPSATRMAPLSTSLSRTRAMGLLSVLGASHWIFKIRWVAVAKITALWWATVHWAQNMTIVHPANRRRSVTESAPSASSSARAAAGPSGTQRARSRTTIAGLRTQRPAGHSASESIRFFRRQEEKRSRV